MVGYDDLYELLIYLKNKLDPEDYSDDYEELELFLYNHFEINIDYFKELISELVPLCDTGDSPLTGKSYRGFGVNSTWLIKEEVK